MKTKKILALLISGVFATTMASQGAVIIMQVQTTTDSWNCLQAGWDLVDGDRAPLRSPEWWTASPSPSTACRSVRRNDGGSYTVVDHTDGDLDNLLQGGRLPTAQLLISL